MNQPEPSKLARAGRILAAVVMCSVGAAILAFAARHNTQRTDFISYWAAGRQLAHRLNPYDGAAILHIQEQAGYTAGRPFFMRNPPWALFLALPLGFVPPVLGSFLWSCGLIFALMGSVALFWARLGSHDDNLRLMSYAWAPAAICLLQQQMSLFLLFGLVLFFYLLESRPFLAGAALLIPALKPHLLLPFWIVLLLWVLTRRRYAVLRGFAAAFAIALAIGFLLEPHCFQDYVAMVRIADIANDFIPSIAQLLRLLIQPRWAWLQLVPAASACCWALWYFVSRRTEWNWIEHGPVVLLVSVMTAPYAWFPDQSVLLIAAMAGLHRAANNRKAVVLFLVFAIAAFIQILWSGEVRSFWLVWTTPVWLLWYLYATRAAAAQLVAAKPVST